MKSSGCLRSDGGDEPPPSIEEPALDLDLLAAAAAAQWTAGFNPRGLTADDLAGLYEAAR